MLVLSGGAGTTEKRDAYSNLDALRSHPGHPVCSVAVFVMLDGDGFGFHLPDLGGEFRQHVVAAMVRQIHTNEAYRQWRVRDHRPHAVEVDRVILSLSRRTRRRFCHAIPR